MGNFGSTRKNLRARLRHFLPTSIAVMLMAGLAFIAAYLAGTRYWEGILILAYYELALIRNITVRRRLLKELKRIDSGCCPNCGYDLRATPERCPECGAVTNS